MLGYFLIDSMVIKTTNSFYDLHLFSLLFLLVLSLRDCLSSNLNWIETHRWIEAGWSVVIWRISNKISCNINHNNLTRHNRVNNNNNNSSNLLVFFPQLQIFYLVPRMQQLVASLAIVKIFPRVHKLRRKQGELCHNRSNSNSNNLTVRPFLISTTVWLFPQIPTLSIVSIDVNYIIAPIQTC